MVYDISYKLEELNNNSDTAEVGEEIEMEHTIVFKNKRSTDDQNYDSHDSKTIEIKLLSTETIL